MAKDKDSSKIELSEQREEDRELIKRLDERTGPTPRELQLLTQLAAAKEELRLTGSDNARAAKRQLADKIRTLRESHRAGRTSIVGGDAVREG